MALNARTSALFCAATTIALTSGVAIAHDHDAKKLPVYLDQELAASAQDAPHEMITGSGLSAEHFLLQRNTDAGVEVGIRAHNRGLSNSPAACTDFPHDFPPTYVDDKGIVHIEVPTGHFLHVFSSGPLELACWSFEYSYDVTGSAAPHNTLQYYDADLNIDTDPSEKSKFLKLDLGRVGSAAGQTNGFGWLYKHHTVVIDDDEGTTSVTQNSRNLAFTPVLDDYKSDPGGYGPGQFEVQLELKEKHGPHVAKFSVIFDVVDDYPHAP